MSCMYVCIRGRTSGVIIVVKRVVGLQIDYKANLRVFLTYCSCTHQLGVLSLEVCFL